MVDNEGAVDLAFRMGSVLLENGAEISRVQETSERVAKAYGVDDMGVYVLSNALFASGSDSGEIRRTAVRYVRSSSIHFARICAVNNLSREIADGRYSVAEANKKLDEIENIPPVKNSVLVAACGIGSACFCFIFGGSISDSLSALAVGLIVQLILNLSEKNKWSKIFSNIIASAAAALFTLALVLLGLGQNTDAIMAGAVIRLVPGVAMTTAIRDFFNSDYLSGTIRMIDAVLVGGSIAVGVGVVFKIASVLSLI